VKMERRHAVLCPSPNRYVKLGEEASPQRSVQWSSLASLEPGARWAGLGKLLGRARACLPNADHWFSSLYVEGRRGQDSE
jgi:hypothetical protein